EYPDIRCRCLGPTQPKAQPPAFWDSPKRTSSSNEDDTVGTCSPSDAREIATRVLLKAACAPTVPASRLRSSSATSALFWPSPSSATLPGAAEVRTRALLGAAIGARPWEKERKRRSYGLRREASITASLAFAPCSFTASRTDSTETPSRRTSDS